LRPASSREALPEDVLHWVSEDRSARWPGIFEGEGPKELLGLECRLLPAAVFRCAMAFNDRHTARTGGVWAPLMAALSALLPFIVLDHCNLVIFQQL